MPLMRRSLRVNETTAALQFSRISPGLVLLRPERNVKLSNQQLVGAKLTLFDLAHIPEGNGQKEQYE
jgi:hypothetical protein